LIRKIQKEEIITWRNRREPQENPEKNRAGNPEKKKIIRNMKRTKL